MAKKPKNPIKVLKKIQREAQIKRESLVGRPRAKSWGSRPTAKDLRRADKKNIEKDN